MSRFAADSSWTPSEAYNSQLMNVMKVLGSFLAARGFLCTPMSAKPDLWGWPARFARAYFFPAMKYVCAPRGTASNQLQQRGGGNSQEKGSEAGLYQRKCQSLLLELGGMRRTHRRTLAVSEGEAKSWPGQAAKGSKIAPIWAQRRFWIASRRRSL